MARLSQDQRVFTRNIADLIIYAFRHGVELTLGECHRPIAMQLLYYFGFDLVKTKRFFKIVRASKRTKTLKSSHLNRLAIDFNFFINDKLTYDFDKIKHVGDYWESLHQNNVWGGDFNKDNIKNGFVDVPHFEMKRTR